MDFLQDFGKNLQQKSSLKISLKMFLRFFSFWSGKALKIPTENLFENPN